MGWAFFCSEEHQLFIDGVNVARLRGLIKKKNPLQICTPPSAKNTVNLVRVLFTRYLKFIRNDGPGGFR